MPGRVSHRGIIEGRQTASYDRDVVVFLIGMRVNSLRRAAAVDPGRRRRWGRCCGVDARTRTAGCSRFRTLPGLRQVTMIQYWESVEKLQAFANDAQRTHRPAWTEFYRKAYKGNTVGIWHETYVVPAGNIETIYANMPLLGLGQVSGVAPVNTRGGLPPRGSAQR